MYMKLKEGKSKVITFSYDDGVFQDIKLLDIMNKYGLKGTFNINTGLYFPENEERNESNGRLKLSEAQRLYVNSGHEIAVHTYTHLFLEQLRSDQILKEILQDRYNIESQYGTFARGMAYPFGRYDERVIALIKSCGICYSRTVQTTENFKFPDNWLTLNPTCHHDHPRLLELANQFINQTSRYPNENWMFYVWGHSYEFDNNNNWNVIEELAKQVSFKNDVWYATNIEIYDYVMAYENLVTSVDKKRVYNPSSIDVWFMENNEIICVHGGETVII